MIDSSWLALRFFPRLTFPESICGTDVAPPRTAAHQRLDSGLYCSTKKTSGQGGLWSAIEYPIISEETTTSKSLRLDWKKLVLRYSGSKPMPEEPEEHKMIRRVRPSPQVHRKTNLKTCLGKIEETQTRVCQSRLCGLKLDQSFCVICDAHYLLYLSGYVEYGCAGKYKGTGTIKDGSKRPVDLDEHSIGQGFLKLVWW